ncbi:MAG: HAMP domain-containing sensor histidine kinase [Zetaproteobacteria bacterium]|nr:HAMP domain-containing sensor histidine kinase [Zetaproteobacteria bacterium]
MIPIYLNLGTCNPMKLRRKFWCVVLWLISVHGVGLLLVLTSTGVVEGAASWHQGLDLGWPSYAWLVLFCLVSSVVICGTLLSRLWLRVIQPLCQLKAAAAELVEGNLKVEIPEWGRDDELDELSRALVKLQDRLCEQRSRGADALVDSGAQALRPLHQDLSGERNKSSRLVRVLCHDLAHAVSLVSSSMYMLRQTLGKQDPERYYQKIDLAVQSQMDLIDQVKAMEANTSGKVKLEVGPVDVLDILSQSQQLMATKLEQKSISVKVRCDLPTFVVQAEPVSLLNNVINNFISNAIKFSFEHSNICVRLYVSQGRKVIEVQDHGVGMSAEVMQHLFDSSQVTSCRGTQGERGVGFGMPLAKSYMDLYGATIAVASQEKVEGVEEHGTTFTLTFA